MLDRVFDNHPHRFTHRGTDYVIHPETMTAARADDAPPPAAPEPTPEALLHRPGLPVATIVLLLTQACNLRCIYCYGDEGRFGAKGVMSRDTALRAVDWLLERSGPQKRLHIGFLGGEPFLNFDVLKAVVLHAEARARAAGKSLRFYATTNGTLFDADKIAFLRDHGVSVQVSLDGPKPLHDANRPFANGRGSFDRVAAGARALLAEIPQASAHAVITPGADPREIRAAIEQLGFGDHTVLPATGSLFGTHSGCAGGDGAHGATATAPGPETDALAPVFDTLEDDAEAWLAAIRARDAARLDRLRFTTPMANALRALLYDIKCRYPCGAGLGLAGIGVRGDIYPCQRFVGDDSHRLGHIDDDTPPGRSDYQDSPLARSPDCAACFARYYCAGGCKHDNLTASGDLFTPSPETCRFRRRQLEMAAYVAASLSPQDRTFAATTGALPPKPCPLDF